MKVSSTEVTRLRRALLAWFREDHRAMPWRETKDPYAICVSEIMLQQTRVDTVRAYYTRWMARFPTVIALAAAPLDEVLSHWSGLGYYARARNLKRAAEQLTAEDRGRVPDDPTRLRALQGVGAYTAGAIASIAFDRPEPILDGNVARILSRLFAIDSPPEQKATRDRLWTLAAALVPKVGAGDFNQAMMELGATVCTPKAPRCEACPVKNLCRARAEDRVETLPRKKTKRAIPTVERLALVVRGGRGGRAVLLGRRPPRGLWGGLWEPPCVELGDQPIAQASRDAAARFGLVLQKIKPLATFTHELSHRRYRFTPVVATGRGEPGDRESGYDALRWVGARELEGLGLSAWAMRAIKESQ